MCRGDAAALPPRKDADMATEIGQIERVDVRSVWPDEAQDFTPWLAKNLALLGDELGLELELVESEAAVGDFSLDILATDKRTGRPMTIENQMGRSDHQHLGQMLTYAAGHDAGTVVWIASDFREEHRAAVEWLNRGTNEEIDFYAVEISSIRIGDSLPAPLFQTVARPPRRTSGRGQPSPDREWYQEFFRPLLEQMEEAGWQWSRRWGSKLKPRWNLHLWRTANRSLGVPLCPCPAIEERSCHTTDLPGNAHPTLALV